MDFILWAVALGLSNGSPTGLTFFLSSVKKLKNVFYSFRIKNLYSVFLYVYILPLHEYLYSSRKSSVKKVCKNTKGSIYTKQKSKTIKPKGFLAYFKIFLWKYCLRRIFLLFLETVFNMGKNGHNLFEWRKMCKLEVQYNYMSFLQKMLNKNILNNSCSFF